MAVRKEQHNRDQKWKETGRNQIKTNTNFDMARSLFGGGGGAAPTAGEEEVEEIVEDVVEEMDIVGVEDDEKEYDEELEEKDD